MVSLSVLCFVTDVNDNAPSFQNLPYMLDVNEDAAVGQQFPLITATDIDNGDNAIVVFSLKPDVQSSSVAEEYNKAFVINPMSGTLTLNTTLDYEKNNLYQFIITAKDKGVPSLTSSTQLVIRVLDVQETTTPVSTVLPEIQNQTLTTHVIDTARGLPAPSMPVVLSTLSIGKQFIVLENGVTGNDGIVTFIKNDHWQVGTYKLRFDTDQYFRNISVEGFYPFVEVVFTIKDHSQDFHIPLQLSPYGYSTYMAITTV